MAFSQTLLTDVTANADTNQAILTMLEMDEQHELQYHVYHIQYEGKNIYCCLSGGVIENNEIQFTAVGLAAFEAMTNIQTETEAVYYAEQISQDEGELSDQIEQVFQKVPDGSRVCFVGDITGEMRDELEKYFTLIH